MPAAEPTHVYVLGFNDSVIKVGRTSNPDRRRLQHANHALIRRATINNEWLLEVPNAKEAEFWLKVLGHQHLEALMGEYFSGDFDTFMAVVIKGFQRRGIIPAETVTFDEAVARTGVYPKYLAGSHEEIRMYQIEGRGRYLVSELDQWWSEQDRPHDAAAV